MDRSSSMGWRTRGPHGQVFVHGVESRGPHGQVFVRGVESLPSANWKNPHGATLPCVRHPDARMPRAVTHAKLVIDTKESLKIAERLDNSAIFRGSLVRSQRLFNSAFERQPIGSRLLRNKTHVHRRLSVTTRQQDDGDGSRIVSYGSFSFPYPAIVTCPVFTYSLKLWPECRRRTPGANR